VAKWQSGGVAKWAGFVGFWGEGEFVFGVGVRARSWGRSARERDATCRERATDPKLALRVRGVGFMRRGPGRAGERAVETSR
jgi:hypothetical protein